MAHSRSKIDRRIAAAPAGVQFDEPSNVVEFRDGWGHVTRRFDLGTLALPEDVAGLLADAFRHHYVAATPHTQRACWQTLQTFARFAREDCGLRTINDLATPTIGRFIAWMDRETNQAGETRSQSGRANRLSYLRQLIEWTKRHHPSRLSQRVDFPFRVYRDRKPQSRDRLTAEQLKAILQVCYEEIDTAWVRFELGQAIIHGDDLPSGTPPDLFRLVRDMAAVDGGVMPARLTLAARRFNMTTIARHGGLRVLTGYLHLTNETVLAFYIALAIQTAANPQPLARIRRDCQRAHPIDEHRVIIDWEKDRAGGQFKRAQRRSFDRRLRYAAPNLIDKLLAMTEPLVTRAAARDREYLILLRSEKTLAVAPISLSSISHGIKGFIVRANERIAIWNRAAPERPRKFLPDFATVLLRGSVATEHYQASGGDILHVQQVLNHAAALTTEAYVRGSRTEQVRRDIVGRLQGLMIAWIGGAVTQAPPTKSTASGHASRATAPFGHDCLNPFDGAAPGAQVGQACRYLGGCLRCPGLIIPIDAPHLARVLQAKGAFERAREGLDPQRWELLYATSYRILVQDILPDFPNALLDPATDLAARLPDLPALE